MRICGVENFANAEDARWPIGMPIKYAVAQAVSGFTVDDMYEIFREAAEAWSRVCGVVFTPTRSTQDANVVIFTRHMDGGGGVLADAQLPVRATSQTQLVLRYDSSDRWVRATNPPSGSIPIGPVTVHEIGHLLGLDHDTSNLPSIMDPTLGTLVTIREDDPVVRMIRNKYPGVPSPGKPAPFDRCDLAGIIEALSDLLGRRSADESLEARQPGRILTALREFFDRAKQGDLLGRLGRLMSLLEVLKSLWPQVDGVLECLGKLSDEDRNKQIEAVRRLLARRDAEAIESPQV